MKRISSLYLSLALMSLGLIQSSCASLQRSSASGYAYADEEASARRDRRAEERRQLADELGQESVDDDADDASALDRRIQLHRAEKAIEGKREREQYFKNKPYMKNDRDRLAFLALDTFEDRARWLNIHQIGGPTVAHSPQIQALIDINDLTLGMTKQAVRDSWGEPELIEVAGSPIYGNERWHYTEQTSSTEGYHTQHRLVYFESGRVAGWESR